MFKTGLFYLHWHDHLEWVYVKKGRVQIQVDAFVDEVKEGELVFINSRQLHAGHPLEAGSQMAAIVFNEAIIRNSGLDSTEERYIMPILTHRLKLPVVLKREDPLSSDILGSVSRLIDELDIRNNGYELFVKSELYRIFGLIFRHHRELAVPPKTMSKRDEDFNELLQTIRSNFQCPTTVEEAARAVSLLISGEFSGNTRIGVRPKCASHIGRKSSPPIAERAAFFCVLAKATKPKIVISSET
jgi:hypothetical protein